MREILFKAKRKDNGEWVEGLLIHIGMYSFNEIEDIDVEYVLGIQRLDKSYEIDPSTLCQFIGLTDKNGKKIYENDIVETETYGYDKDYFITYIKFGAVFGIQGFHLANRRSLFYAGQLDLSKIDDTEVIGNVFDNPELVEERES